MFKIKNKERRQWCRSVVFVINFKYISHHVRVFLLVTLNIKLPAGTFLDSLFWVVLNSVRPFEIVLSRFRSFLDGDSWFITLVSTPL